MTRPDPSALHAVAPPLLDLRWLDVSFFLQQARYSTSKFGLNGVKGDCAQECMQSIVMLYARNHRQPCSFLPLYFPPSPVVPQIES